MAEKGYHSVSVKEIAKKAGVSEMTVFRHFETKLSILHQLIQEYSYIPYFELFFKEQLSGELSHDLTKIANIYLSFMNKNKNIFLIAVRERGNLPELMEIISEENTKQLQMLLAQYLNQQMNAGHIRAIQCEEKAIGFLTGLFGFFVSTSLWGSHFLHDQEERFIQNAVDTFVNGVRN
ncbi:DNA-binding transcriptional repressor FabR [compost metagenome]